MTARPLIDQFMNQKRFALIGASRSASHFSRALMKEFLKHSYDVIPVNPHATEIEGRRAFPRIGDVTPPVTSVLVLSPTYMLQSVLDECNAAGITLAWIYGVTELDGISESTRKQYEERGTHLIPGYCPFMFFHKASWYHRLHRGFMKMTGSYPT